MVDKINRTEVQMRYGDLDALGHVNNANFLTYMELGRTNYFKEILHDFKTSKVNFVVNHAEIDFRMPILFHHSPIVSTWISHVGKTSCVFSHVITEKGTDIVFAQGKTVVVWIDMHGKKMDIDAEMKDLLLSLMVEEKP